MALNEYEEGTCEYTDFCIHTESVFGTCTEEDFFDFVDAHEMCEIVKGSRINTLSGSSGGDNWRSYGNPPDTETVLAALVPRWEAIYGPLPTTPQYFIHDQGLGQAKWAWRQTNYVWITQGENFLISSSDINTCGTIGVEAEPHWQCNYGQTPPCHTEGQYIAIIEVGVDVQLYKNGYEIICPDCHVPEHGVCVEDLTLPGCTPEVPPDIEELAQCCDYFPKDFVDWASYHFEPKAKGGA